MNYRSIADMNATIVRGIHALPRDIDLVVGIPRSGILAANILSLAANIPMTDLDSFLAGKVFATGSTKGPLIDGDIAGMRRMLVLDDSINSGAAMRAARRQIAATEHSAKTVFAAVYGTRDDHGEVDHVFEIVPSPRMFQWNVMQHGYLGQCCMDIDGVLCADPTAEENDDGPAYERFLRDARPLHRPSRRIAYLVTSRLEKYRAATEEWLAGNGISYGRLAMLDLPSMRERRRLSAHGAFKGDFYRNCDAILFIESEHHQAVAIAERSGKPVLCMETQQIVSPVSASEPKRRRPRRLFSGWTWPKAPAAPVAAASQAWPADPQSDMRYVLVAADQQAKPRTLISYLGPAPDNVAEIILSVVKACQLKAEFPIVVISHFDHGLMASDAAPTEFLPEKQHVASLDPDSYARYVNRRWALILEKWNIEREVALGLGLGEYLASQARTA